MARVGELIWARYDKGRDSAFYLLVYLGENASAIHTLKAEALLDHEIAILRANLEELKVAPLNAIQEWIKDHLPSAYKNAYRCFESSKLVIDKTYSIKKL